MSLFRTITAFVALVSVNLVAAASVDNFQYRPNKVASPIIYPPPPGPFVSDQALPEEILGDRDDLAPALPSNIEPASRQLPYMQSSPRVLPKMMVDMAPGPIEQSFAPVYNEQPWEMSDDRLPPPPPESLPVRPNDYNKGLLE